MKGSATVEGLRRFSRFGGHMKGTVLRDFAVVAIVKIRWKICTSICAVKGLVQDRVSRLRKDVDVDGVRSPSSFRT